jgi:uncharacterized protein YdeI (YjbR/CyaY-like superfamily)
MKLGKTLYVTNRKDWRKWLSKNHAKKTEIWLIYYLKETGKPRIPYNDAVEEALCFGWIDSIIKKIDKERFTQRFSVRRKTSELSQLNKERVRKLISQRKMTKSGLAAIAHAFDPDKEKKEKFIISPAILKQIKSNKEAWTNFRNLPESYKRIRIAYIESQGRHSQSMFERSLNHFIKMTAKNKRFGFVR